MEIKDETILKLIKTLHSNLNLLQQVPVIVNQGQKLTEAQRQIQRLLLDWETPYNKYINEIAREKNKKDEEVAKKKNKKVE